MLSPFEFAAKHKTSYKKGEQDRINSPSVTENQGQSNLTNNRFGKQEVLHLLSQE
jgi:hypothetical protein